MKRYEMPTVTIIDFKQDEKIMAPLTQSSIQTSNTLGALTLNS